MTTLDMAAPSSHPPYLPPYAEFQDDTQSLRVASSEDDIYIAVMGMTGAGKSKFIADCTGMDVKVSDGLRSCTVDVDEYTFVRKGQNVHLIDTPGFDDTNRSDREVLEGIAAWMANAYAQHIKLSAILYLHRITDVRVGGAGLRNLRMFKKLCGDEFYPRVYLVTTMWDIVPPRDGQRREAQLVEESDLWGELLKNGAHIEQHDGTRDSAMDILSQAIRYSRKSRTTSVLKVQKEMIDENLRLDQTAAGQEFETELKKQREHHEKEMQALKREIKELLEDNELKAAEQVKKEQREFERKIAQSKEDQAQLKKSLQDLQDQQAEDIRRMREEYESDRAAYEEKIERLESGRRALETMDPSTSTAIQLRQQFAQDEAEVVEMQEQLAAKDESIRKKAKRLFVRGQQWVKDNPKAVKMGVNAIKLVAILGRVTAQ